ncbi:Fc.00g104810.m01.CDS01 [Cosmosporella sp. VM-42]
MPTDFPRGFSKLTDVTRARKVKCDEGRPACRRCVSTGRVCEGDSSLSSRSPTPPRVLPTLAISIDEKGKGYFEWFKCRTVPKIPGSFHSSFWNTLLIQASHSEPAVLHAVLALSSVHRRGTTNDDGREIPHTISAEQEQMTLKHYVKAVNLLQTHCSNRDRASSRVALISCVVFVCLELLRGHFATAQTHLLNGLKILGETELLFNKNDGILRFKPSLGSTDEWIVEAFTRLHLQVELFKHTYDHPSLILQVAWPEPPIIKFRSVNEAWQHMERLLNRVFFLTKLARQQKRVDSESPEALGSAFALLEHQQRIRTELVRWPDMFEQLMPPKGQRDDDEEKCYHLLSSFHTMVTIIAETCLQPDDEMVFDSHTDMFASLINQLAKLRISTSTVYPIRYLPRQLADMTRSIIDMGWVPPLYFIAVKCRVHRIRLQAVRLLETTSHREGLWDARMAACVARKVLELEEKEFYKDLEVPEDFLFSRPPRLQDLSEATLPESNRIRELEVVMSGAPMDRVLLFCKQKQQGIDRRVLLSEYSMSSQFWIDTNVGG